jgi:alpha-galactosidase
MDPLTGAVCNTREIVQMADEMLIACEEWLPQWKNEIVKAKERISGAKSDGTYIPVKEGYKGAARK